MHTFVSSTSIACILGLSLVAQPVLQRPLVAQQKSAQAQTGLACFEEMTRLSQPHCSQMRGDVVMGVVQLWWKYRPIVVDSILDGLERLALTSDNLSVRTSAAIWLGTPGETDPPMPGIVVRLERVYRSSEDFAVRRALLTPAMWQRDTAAAVSFLELVARDDRPEDRVSDEPPPLIAVQHLADLGPRGRVVLERLNQEGSVKNRRARVQLDWLAKRDYRMR